MEEENKKVTRRKFLEDSSKKAIMGTAAGFLGLGLVRPTPVQAAGCWFGCSFGCSGGCHGGCTVSCYTTCTSRCSSACNGGGFEGASATDVSATCGSPVLEREASNRHITA